MSQEVFAASIGLASKGNVSVIEREERCSLDVALAIEALSGGRIDAARLNADVAKARAVAEPDAHRVTCITCGERHDDPRTRACSFVDCPHAEREAA